MRIIRGATGGARANPPSNHGPAAKPWMNAVYADGSADTQHGHCNFKSDAYGRANVGSSATFAAWYVPLPRRSPSPY